MTKLRALAVLIVLAALLSWPCGKQIGVRGIELAVTFSARVLTDNLFTDVTYRVRTSSSLAPIADDNRIVSIFAYHGRPLLRDEYEPPVPTSRWEPGKEYTFTRRIYVPAFIDEFDPGFRGKEKLDLAVGLVSASDKNGGPGLVLFRQKLRVVPAAESPVIAYLSGWHDPEADPGNPDLRWRWTSKEARVAIDNPGRDALLVLRGSSNPDAVPGQKITLSIEGMTLEKFTPDRGEFERRYTVKKEWLGTGKDFELVIAVDKTFIPATVTPGSNDERELGVRISLLYFR
jgi:hypothetical protein